MQIFRKRWKDAVKEDRCWVDPYRTPTDQTTHWSPRSFRRTIIYVPCKNTWWNHTKVSAVHAQVEIRNVQRCKLLYCWVWLWGDWTPQESALSIDYVCSLEDCRQQAICIPFVFALFDVVSLAAFWHQEVVHRITFNLQRCRRSLIDNLMDQTIRKRRRLYFPSSNSKPPPRLSAIQWANTRAPSFGWDARSTIWRRSTGLAPHGWTIWISTDREALLQGMLCMALELSRFYLDLSIQAGIVHHLGPCKDSGLGTKFSYLEPF